MKLTTTISKLNNGKYLAETDELCRALGETEDEALELVNKAVQNYVDWLEVPFLSSESPIIIGGCGRSGTTLLRAMLDSHPNIACGPESELFLQYNYKIIQPNQPNINFNQDMPNRLIQYYSCPPETFMQYFQQSKGYLDFVERFLKEYAQRNGKKRWAEKTPKNIVCLQYIFEHFPNAKCIHVIRDGRDVYCSLRTHPKYKWENGQAIPTHILNSRESCADRWVDDTSKGLQWREDERYMEIRYEDLIENTETVLRRVLDFVEEDWDDSVLEYYKVESENRNEQFNIISKGIKQPVYKSAKSRWKTDMDDDDKSVFKSIAGQLLIDLEYANDMNW